MQNDITLLKQELVRRLEDYFGPDTRRVEHAKSVLRYAEELLKEEQADPYVVFPAAVFHDVGIKVAEEKYGSPAAEYQEKEGPAVAGRILVDMEYVDENIYEVCAIIAHHHSPGPLESENFRVVYDADLLTNLKEASGIAPEELRRIVDTKFLTASGRRLAEKVLP